MIRRLLNRVALGACLSLPAVAPALAASNALYLDLPTVPGPSTAAGHVDWITANSLQWGVGVGISTSVGHNVRAVGPFSLSEAVWTQSLDTSVPGLFGASLAGTAQPKARFDLVAGTSTNGAPYLSLEMGDQTFITGVSLSNDSVSSSIGSTNYKWTYDPKGFNRKGSPVSTEFDLAKKIAKGPLSRAATSYTGSAAAATVGETSIYLRLGDSTLNIAGDSQARYYENWIELDSVQLGVGRSFAAGSGGGSAGGLSTPSVSELTITHHDIATLPATLANLAKGGELQKAVIEYVTLGQSSPVTFMQLVLEDVLFSSASLSASASGASVSASLNFLKMTQTAWSLTDKGVREESTKGGYVYTSFSYDVAKDKSSTGSPDTSTIALFGSGNLTGLEKSVAASQSAAPPMAPAIPEPRTWVLMLAGLAVLLSAVFRQKT